MRRRRAARRCGRRRTQGDGLDAAQLRSRIERRNELSHVKHDVAPFAARYRERHLRSQGCGFRLREAGGEGQAAAAAAGVGAAAAARLVSAAAPRKWHFGRRGSGAHLSSNDSAPEPGTQTCSTSAGCTSDTAEVRARGASTPPGQSRASSDMPMPSRLAAAAAARQTPLPAPARLGRGGPPAGSSATKPFTPASKVRLTARGAAQQDSGSPPPLALHTSTASMRRASLA